MEKNNEETPPKNDVGETQIHYRGWKAMPFVIGNETFEKLGAIGTLANLLIYLTSVFNMKSITAATILNIFNGSTNLVTLVGAFLCDTYFGRYKTLGFAIVASFLGLLVIHLTAAVKNLHPPHCITDLCKGPTAGQMTFLMFGFGLMIIGAGGIRPCNLAFGADQFNPNTEAGKKGINSFFNWYVFTYTFAMMVSITVIVYVQTNVSWALGLGIPAILMLIACILFFVGSKIYVKVKATGSPMTSVAQVLVAAIKKRKLKQPDQPWLSLFEYTPPGSINSKLSYSDQFRFLDKAAIITAEDQIKEDGSAADPWRLCSMQQVEEVKCLVRVLPVWLAGVLFFVTQSQQNTYAIFQALQSNRRIGNFTIPAASYTVFAMLSLSIWLPIYDRIVVPFLLKFTKKEGGITILQRQGIGIFLTTMAMLLSGLVEDRRRVIALTKPSLGIEPRKGAISSMSASWLIPQLTLYGLADGFGAVSQLEFYYKQFPENMRSIGGSIFFCAIAGGSYLNGLLIIVVHRMSEGSKSGDWLPEDLNKGRLDYFYYFLTGIGLVNLCYFLICSKWYKYKGAPQNASEIHLMSKQPEKNTV
ncbi:protein NRT1/ PTR FAMILY 2.11-like [Cucumis melo var. makuwa]|uniref:Protein NRT1/ PTR FAMILY 2.11-like n=2 Tax=Cucumis melo TaxID=3656 RepID=A0A1S3BWQ9_CUCME|nr:protein NRT1/ PTR FAMILY 2.11-like [Cucumis melo]KAA0057922.1 protein NRT1/ PTR FAMILY 2.11-like [Cucumis melo var. makuwa]TYJ98610.1 protein NRT1/ PTR FAMILY 2.11-like [Cucumis melo var. makuwa]